jgi:hypothetical protein
VPALLRLWLAGSVHGPLVLLARLGETLDQVVQRGERPFCLRAPFTCITAGDGAWICGSGMTCWRRLWDWQAVRTWDALHYTLLVQLEQGIPGQRPHSSERVCSHRPEPDGSAQIRHQTAHPDRARRAAPGRSAGRRQPPRPARL